MIAEEKISANGIVIISLGRAKLLNIDDVY